MPRLLRHKPTAPRGGPGGRPPAAVPTARAAPAPAPGGSRGRPPPPAWSVAPPAGTPPSASLAAPAASAAGACHRAAAPASAPPARTPLNANSIAKLVSSVTATSISICLVYLPFLHFLSVGHLEVTAIIWNTQGLQIGLMNALTWLLYGASVYKRDGGPDVILSCAWSSGVMLCCLMLVCAHTRKLYRATFWYIASMISIVGALVILQLEPVGDALYYLEHAFGYLGICSLLSTHLAQLLDLKAATHQVQIAGAVLTIAPSALIGFQQFLNVFVKGTNQSILMKVTCWINAVGYSIELFMTLQTQPVLIRKYKAMKSNTRRLIIRSINRSCPIHGDARSTEGNELVDYGEALQLLFDTEIKFVGKSDKESKVMVNTGSFGMEISRVLGGDIVPGSLILVSGDPGVGKSTLMLQIASNILEGLKVGESSPVVYVSSEETVERIGNRACRMNITSSQLYIYSGTDIEDALDKILLVSPRVVIVDSIQTVCVKSSVESSGSLSQVKECAYMLLLFAKQTNIPVFLTGSVTKTGDIAVHHLLEQIVDVFLYMEGERCSSHRLLRPVKNQFGPMDELGVFEMTGSGLKVVLDPSQLFLVDHDSDSETPAGLAVAVILQGSRTFAVTVQANCAFGSYIRQVVGIPESRADAIISIVIKQGLYKLQDNAVFLNVPGGFKLTESAGDLAIAASLCSSFLGFPIPNNVAFIGEVGPGGELRTVPRTEKRVMDIAKLGYKKCVVPKSSEKLLKQVHIDMEILSCSNLKQVVNNIIRPQI